MHVWNHVHLMEIVKKDIIVKTTQKYATVNKHSFLTKLEQLAIRFQMCYPKCKSHDDCPQGHECFSNGQCLQPCSSDVECSYSHYCDKYTHNAN